MNGAGLPEGAPGCITDEAGKQMAGERIYLDFQATTPTDTRVVEAMLPYFTRAFGNPHSIQHAFGRDAEAAVERARGRIASLIGAEAREIVFTSGATESNNLAIKGVSRFRRQLGRDHVVTVATEHKCVLESCRRLEREGFRVSYLPVRENGLIDLERLAAEIDERTALVSIMAVNNEIGVIQPVAEIGRLCRAQGIAYHCDAAQAVGKIPIDVEADAIDLLSVSGHKAYGPMGIGALYIRRRPRIRLEPLFDGGGQERGFRSGTLPAPLCVGLGEACAIAAAEMAEERARLAGLSRRFLETLRAEPGEVVVNGDPERRIPGNLNVSFPGVEAQALMDAVPGVAVSTGSACTSASVEPSYVLRALGVPDDLANASLRVGFGRSTSEAEVVSAAEQIAAAVRQLRRAAVTAGDPRAAE